MRGLKLYERSDISILVIGDYMVDRYLYCDVSRISPEGPVPVAKVEHIEQRIGGAGNVALNIMALGCRCKVVTCIGDDVTGQQLVKALCDSGADISNIYYKPGRKTSQKTRIVAQNQQLLRCDEEEISGVGEDFLCYIQDHIDEIFQNTASVILSDYGKGVMTEKVTQFVITHATKLGIPVFVDPKGVNYDKYRGATVCTPNLKELGEATGYKRLEREEDVFQAALLLCAQENFAYVLVTRSEKGMSLVSNRLREKQDFPAVVQEVCDVTGAGDTVISTLAVCWASGYSLEQCCYIANAAASVVVSKFGAATASVDEINQVISFPRINRADSYKICDLEHLAGIVKQMHRIGKKVVFTNGCFDLVHAGHIASFWKARSYGDVLIVAVNSDDSIRRLKGVSRPIITLDYRMRLLEALEMIDFIIPFDNDTPQTLIEVIRPDVLVKGSDWKGKTVAGADILEKYGGQLEFVDLEQGLSTSSIIEKILTLNR